MEPNPHSFFPRVNPRFRILCYEEYLGKISAELEEILIRNDIQEDKYYFKQGSPLSVKNKNNLDPIVVPLFLTINIWDYVRNAAATYTILKALYEITKYLGSEETRDKIHHYTMNSGALYFAVLSFLKNQGAIDPPLYFHSFGYYCLMICKDKINTRRIHVGVFSNEGQPSDHVILPV